MSGPSPADNWSTATSEFNTRHVQEAKTSTSATAPSQLHPVRFYSPPVVPRYVNPRSRVSTTATVPASTPSISVTAPTIIPTYGSLPQKTTTSTVPDPQSVTFTSSTAATVKINSRSFSAPLNQDAKPPTSTAPSQRRIEPYIPPTISTCAPNIQHSTTVTTKAGSTAPIEASKPPTSTATHPEQCHKCIEPYCPPTAPTSSASKDIVRSVANKQVCPKFFDQPEHFGFQPRSDRIRAPQLDHSQTGTTGSGAAISATASINVISSSALPKVASPPSAPVCNNGYEDSRDRDSIVVKDRKVRISNEASLYALCRSWMRNGSHEEKQAQFGNGVKSLPRPLAALADAPPLPKKRGRSENEGNDEEEESVDNLSAQELLQRHVIHARSIRARLREERLRRIARYKTRLATLLHPQM